jgi:hypothetical protein
MTRQAGAAGEHWDEYLKTYVPNNFNVTRTSRGMRGVGAYDEGTVKIGPMKRLVDRLIG